MNLSNDPFTHADQLMTGSDYLSWHVQPVIHIFSINEAFVLVTQFCSLFAVFL